MADANICTSDGVALSQKYLSLTGPAKARYRQKVNLCGFDPYLLKNSECSDDLRDFPSIQYPDIVNYLVLQTSWATGEEMKAYKALDAYNFFVSGWVSTVFTKKVAESNSVVVTAKINHSQRTRTTPLSTWLLADMSGEVILGHCDCMAGLCEACSHIGALLFAVEAGYRMRDSVTCTGEKSQWIMPSYVKEIPYMPVSDMDLTSANKLRKQLEEPDGSKQRAEKKRPQIEVPTASERDNFFKEISNYGKSAILSLIPPYNSSFIFHEEQVAGLPESVAYQVKSRCSSATLEEPELIDEIFSALHVNVKEAETVESATRNQNESKLWYTQRAARITASQFKSTCRSNPEKPSKSLMKMVCYPEAHRFSSAATKWGIDHESKAREDYICNIAGDHLNLSVADCGLHINPRLPFLGASPDGLVMCECCGIGLCEVKCPYKHRKSTIQEAANSDKDFCLKFNDSELELDNKHQYYYQVQCQLFVTEMAYCDFVVWTEFDLFVQRLMPDEHFWNVNLPKAISFYKKCILPEVIRGCQPTSGCDLSSDSEEDGPWCTCQEDKCESTLIACARNCRVKWFHMECVGLGSVPKGMWVCPSCTKHRL